MAEQRLAILRIFTELEGYLRSREFAYRERTLEAAGGAVLKPLMRELAVRFRPDCIRSASYS